MGLLDQFANLNPQQTQGLLAAAAQMLQQSGPSRTPTSFGQALGGGIMAYQGASAEAQRRKQQEDEARQTAEMRGLQIQESQGVMADREASRKKASHLLGLQQQFAQRGVPQQQAAPQMGMASPPNAQEQPAPQATGGQDPYQQAMGYARFLQENGMIQESIAVIKEAQAFKPKYSTTPQTMRGADGKLRNVQLAEDGSKPVELAYDVKPDMVEVGLGDRKQFVDRNGLTPGQTFKMGVDPDTVYSGEITKRGQNMVDARASQEIAAGGKPPPGYRWAPGGTLAAIPGGPGDKLPESQQKQVVGVNNLSNAIREYRADLANFGKLDAMTPDGRAKMGTKYNNMMLQAKEAYNLGVLNGPDLDILTNVITDPRSMKGMITSKSALDTQASELDRIMQDVGAVSGQARQPQNKPGAQPQPAQPARKSVLKGQVIDGYRFKGGAPGDQNNWEKI